MVNALGSGVLETRALMAFLPRWRPVCWARPLKMPNIATWWCGEGGASGVCAKRPTGWSCRPGAGHRLPFDAPQPARAALIGHRRLRGGWRGMAPGWSRKRR
jgi:hypothetical protein